MLEGINQEDIIKDLERAQGKHLRAIERWAGQQPAVAGVPLVKAVVYDLIQAVNQAYLARLIGGTGEGAK